MATIIREDGFRFIIWPTDHEPPHVHIVKGGEEIEAHIIEGTLRNDWGMKPAEIRKALALVLKHRTALMDAWNHWHS